MTVKLDTRGLPSDAELRKMFDAVPLLERYRVADQVVRAGVKPITARAKQIVPRSSKTGTNALRSAKQQASADWATPLYKTLKAVVRKGKNGGAIAVTGPEWEGPAGAGQKAYLIAEHKQTTRRRKVWGHDPKSIPLVARKIRNFIVQAADETRQQQLAAMKAKLRQKIDEMMRG